MALNNNFIWTPDAEQIRTAKVNSLLKRLGVADSGLLHEASIKNLDKFWDAVMKDLGIEWFQPYTNVRNPESTLPWTQWFTDGKINIVHNCVDRHRDSKNTALAWEGDGGETREINYRELFTQVNQAANVLKQFGIGKNDTVAILMPMVPEVVVQLFATLKLGAVVIPIFSGFGVEAIASRLQESSAKLLFTSDVVYRRGKAVNIKAAADAACQKSPTVKTKIIFKRGNGNCEFDPKIDFWWHEVVPKADPHCDTVVLDSEHPSLILFTSGTTGKPKGAVHTHAGCLATIGKELRYHFNVDSDTRFFWFTDIGWMMGPWEMIGVTLFGGTLFLFEGAPDFPSPSRLWEVVERHKINVLGISPTAIRLLMRSSAEYAQKFKMPSLKMLGSTGEPWDPESYAWFFSNVGKNKLPILNISGGTEIIGCLLLPLPTLPIKSCSLGTPGLGVDADVWDEDGNAVRESVGHLVCKQALPSMTKGFLNSKERYLETYFEKFPGVWYHGDWAIVDVDGQWFLRGRSDDTIKIAGKRIGPVEFEAALLQNPKVSEVAAVGVPDSLKGETCVCFVVLKPGNAGDDALRRELVEGLTVALGKAMTPKEVRFVTILPKTRSAKILRGMIKRLYLGQPAGDTAAVENPEALEAILKST
jgi:acetyl-CoA synthetase